MKLNLNNLIIKILILIFTVTFINLTLIGAIYIISKRMSYNEEFAKSNTMWLKFYDDLKETSNSLHETFSNDENYENIDQILKEFDQFKSQKRGTFRK